MTATSAFDSLLALALIVRFLLEIALLVGVGVLAWQNFTAWRWVAVILCPLAVAVIWGLFLSPKAAIALPTVAQFAIEAALFLGTAMGLLLIGFPVVALIGAVVWLVDRIGLAILG